MTEDKIEKIEVSKHNGSFYYTGILTELEDGWVEINTTRGETLKFRKEQIMQRRAVVKDKNHDNYDAKAHEAMYPGY